MCGRVRLSSDLREIKIAFGIPPERPAPNFPPTWNGAPTDTFPIVGYNAKEGTRGLSLMRWGLIPYWAKDGKVGFANINAKAETVDTKPAFREAFARGRRCLVPVDNFYEWKKTPSGKQPYAIALADGGIIGAGGTMGDVEIADGRTGPQLHDYHVRAERPMRRASQPHAGRAGAGGMAGLARRGTARRAAVESAAGAVSGRRHDVLAGQ